MCTVCMMGNWIFRVKYLNSYIGSGAVIHLCASLLLSPVIHANRSHVTW